MYSSRNRRKMRNVKKIWKKPMTFEYEKQDHRLVIDETAAEIVRYIFKLRLEGKAAVRISRI